MSKLITNLIGTAFFAVCLSGTAFAQSDAAPENSWVSQSVRMIYKGEGYSDRRKAKLDSGELLYTTSTAQPGLYLSCIAGKFRAGLVFEPQDMRSAFAGNTVVGVSGGGGFVPVEKGLTYVDMRLDGGEKIGLGRWHYIKKKQAVFSRKRVPAVKLYNAVIRKQKVTVEINSADAVTLEFPKINSEFANFGSECGLGRYK